LVLTTPGRPASAAAAAEDVAAVAEPAAGCGQQGAVGVAVELRAASVAAGPAVVAAAGPRAGTPAVARTADHRG
jgi:hypothetical protein